MRKLIVISAAMLLTAVMHTGNATSIDDLDFILPEAGCPMVHCDPQMTDLVHLPAPTDNVEIVWHRCELPSERTGYSAWASGNGDIAACTFSGCRDNLVVYDYDGNHVWTSGNLLNAFAVFSAPMIDVCGRIIACDNKVVIMVDPYDCDNDGKIIEWTSELPMGGLPYSPVITEDGTIIIATDRGPVYAYDSRNGTLLAWKYLKADGQINLLYYILNIKDRGFYSTINTPCVNGNRVYISTQYKGKIGLPSLRHYARLYALDVDMHSQSIDERLKIAWYYEFGGPSGASPLFINNTIYFDGNRPRPSFLENPHIFAVTDMGNYGVEEWKKAIPNPTLASFTCDPRGGFWIVDHIDRHLVHYATEDGSVIEEIDVDDIVQEAGRHKPSSVVSICGNETNPILIVSGTAIRFLRHSSFVIAINLTDDNSLLWKVKISDDNLFSIDFPFGQYPVLMKNDKPRIVFTTIRGGTWAVGSVNSTP